MKQILIITLLFININTQALNQRQFVERLKNTHPFFTQQALSSKIRRIEKQATTANENWVIGIDGSYNNEDASDIITSTYTKLDTTSVDISAKKKLLDLGGDLTFKHSLIDRDKDINATRNRFSLNYKHPLLRDNAGVNDKLDTDIAQIAIEQDRLQRLEREEDFVLKNLRSFINLAYAQERLSINQRRLTLANQELNLVKQKFAASVVDKVDVLLQEDAYQAAEQQLLQAQQDLTLLRHEIAIILAFKFEQVVAQVNIYRTYEFDNQYTQKQLLQNIRILQITELDKKASKRQLLSFKNQQLPELDLNLGITTEGENNNYTNSLKNQGASWRIGLGLSYPLGHTKSRSDVSKTQTILAQLEQRKQEQLLELKVRIRTLSEKNKLLIKILKSNQKQIEIAKARTIEEKKRYANGNGDASFVINAQNNEQNARLNYVQIAADYQITLLEYRATLDQLLP